MASGGAAHAWRRVPQLPGMHVPVTNTSTERIDPAAGFPNGLSNDAGVARLRA